MYVYVYYIVDFASERNLYVVWGFTIAMFHHRRV